MKPGLKEHSISVSSSPNKRSPSYRCIFELKSSILRTIAARVDIC